MILFCIILHCNKTVINTCCLITDQAGQLLDRFLIELCHTILQLLCTISQLIGAILCGLSTCQQLGRRCYTMELDPRYSDVIVKRYMKFTGATQVEVIRDGQKIVVT